MILTLTDQGFCESESLLQALDLEEKEAPVISVVGAGGKTTTVMRLKEEYLQKAMPVVVTTTTHMMMPDSPAFLDCRGSQREQSEKAEEILAREGWLFVGTPAESNRIASAPEPFLHELLSKRIPVIIEADGARRLPLKMPGEREPVIHPATDTVIGVAGLDAVDRPISEVCFRPELTAAFLEKTVDALITCEDMVKIAFSDRGLQKGVGKDMDFHVLLNKADTQKRREDGKQIARMMAENGFCRVHLTAGLDGV